MTNHDLENATRKALDQVDRAGRRFVWLACLLAAVELLFLWGFLTLSDFSNRIHVLIFWSTVTTFTLMVLGLAILWRHISSSTQLILKAIDVSSRRPQASQADAMR